MNNAVFEKAMENVRNYENIKLVMEPNYHTTKNVSEKILATEIQITQILMNKPVVLGSSILEITKIVLYEFRYD